MATRVKMSELERRIIDRVYLSRDGFERIEDLLDATGADRTQFVDALETLEGAGYLSVANLGGSVIVSCEDPVGKLSHGEFGSRLFANTTVGQC